MLDPVTTLNLVVAGFELLHTTYKLVKNINSEYTKSNDKIIPLLYESRFVEEPIFPKKDTHNAITESIKRDQRFEVASSQDRGLLLALGGVYDFLISNKGDRTDITLEVSMSVTPIDNSELYTIGIWFINMSSEHSTEEAENNIYSFIAQHHENISKEKWDNQGYVSYIVFLNSNTKAKIAGLKTDDNLIANMSILGGATCRSLYTNFDDKIIKVFSGGNHIPDRRRKVNLLIEAIWEGNETPLAFAMMEVSKVINEKSGVIDNTIIEKISKMTIVDGKRNIMLLGRSGAGKSYVGNLLYGLFNGENKRSNANSMFLESDCGSCTHWIQKAEAGPNGEYEIWDTPGLLDQYGRDDIFVRKIRNSMYDMGQVSVIILCEQQLERIEFLHKKMIKQYAEIIGHAMESRLIVLVNRQSNNITQRQKTMLKNNLQEGGINVMLENIYWINASVMDREQTNIVANNIIEMRDKVINMCKEHAVGVGPLQRVKEGLEILKSEMAPSKRKRIQFELIELSNSALKREIMTGGGPEPVLSNIRKDKVVLKREKHDFSPVLRTGCIRKWSLRMPENTTKLLDVINDKLTYGNSLDDALSIVASRRAVYVDIKDSKIEEHVTELGNKVWRTIYTLLPVDRGLNLEIQQHVKNLRDGEEVKSFLSPR